MCRVNHFERFVLGMLALLFFVRGARGQQADCQRRALPVALRDKLNLPIQDISASDFEAKVRGESVKILSLAPDPRPHRLVLILDTSGSMRGTDSDNPLIALEFALARHFFDVNRQRSRIALLMFNDDVTEVVDFARGNSGVGDKLQQIATDRNFVKTNVKGRTALRDAIFEGLQLLDHLSSADALYILTDGGDNASKRKPSEVTERLAVTSVRLFAVILHEEGGYRIRTPEELSGPSELSEIAGRSGGEILSAAAWHGKQIALSADADAKLKTQETLGRLYQTILQDNLMEIELPFPLAKNEHWELKLSDAARRHWKGTQITYPTTLISCNSEVSGSGSR